MHTNTYKSTFIYTSQKKQWKDNPKVMKMVVVEEGREQAGGIELKLP